MHFITFSLALGLGVFSQPTDFPADLQDHRPPEQQDMEITDEMLRNAVFTLDVDKSVIPLVDEESEEPDTVVLQSDVLFPPLSAELSTSAEEELGSLLDDIPQGASVDISGHTDSLPMPESSGMDNQELSEARAKAVAEALKQSRSDVDITSTGYADTKPAVGENPDDPSTLAKNRRVEVRYYE